MSTGSLTYQGTEGGDERESLPCKPHPPLSSSTHIETLDTLVEFCKSAPVLFILSVSSHPNLPLLLIPPVMPSSGSGFLHHLASRVTLPRSAV